MRTAVALNSAVPLFGSVASIVMMLTSTSSGKCNVMKTRPGRSPGSIRTGASIVPRAELIDTISPSSMPSASASSGDTSIVSPRRLRAAVAARLHAGVVRVEPAPGGEPQRELLGQRLDRRVVDHDAERCRATAVVGVVRPQPAVQVRRLEPVLEVARPLDAAQLLEPLHDMPACIGDRLRSSFQTSSLLS